MKMRDLARLAIIKTNPHWPFSRLNKTPYYAAIKRFVSLIQKFPEIKSAYLRHGLLRKDWIPAISDIDITLISENDLAVDHEFLLLRSFWSQFQRIKNFFPMLGEVDLLNEGQTPFWTQFSIRGFEAKNWELLNGTENLHHSYRPDPETLSVDSMDHALECYLNLFHRQMYRTDHDPRLKLPEMKRFSSKILRYIHYLDTGQTKNGQALSSKSKVTDLIFTILMNFEKSLQNSIPVKKFDSSSNWYAHPSLIEWGRLEKVDNIRLEELEPVKEIVESILLSHNRDILILKELTHPGQIERLIDAIHGVFAPRNTRPLIITRPLFTYVVHFHDPFLYTHLLRCGKIAFGSDPMSDISPPDFSSFVRCVLKQIPNVLTFPQSDALFTFLASEPRPERMLDSMVERALFIKLFLERQFMRPSHNELLLASQEYYSSEYQRIADIKKRIGTVSEKEATHELFCYWKGISKDIQALLKENRQTEDFLQNGRFLRA